VIANPHEIDRGVGALKYKRFEDLPVWQAAIDLAIRMYRLTGTGCLRSHPGLRDQLERAAQSVSNNIAEGFERGTHAELIQYLYIALASAGEVRSMTYTLVGLEISPSISTDVEYLRSLTLSISRQLSSWLEALKANPALGPKDRTPATRHTAREIQRRDAQLEYLREIQTRTRPSSSPEPERGDDSP
jgi:four helix bundle protein